MKARVKATGEIVDVCCDFKGMNHDFLDEKGKGYMSNEITIFDNDDYEQGWKDGYYEAVSTNTDPDYWARLEHQYAGMAMQQLVSIVNVGYDYVHEETAIIAYNFAHALVEKMKEMEERK